MTGEVRLHEAASAEFEAAFEWYLLRSEFVASKFSEEISLAIEKISEVPQRWPAAKSGVRKYVLPRFAFAIFYRELPSAVQMLAIAHGHRKPGYWAARL